MNPVRVCFLIDELATAGTETQLLALIRNLDRAKVLPHLVLLRGDNPASQALEPKDCPVLRLGIGKLRDPRSVFGAYKFAQFLWREKIDVVQAYFPDSSYFGVPTAWLAGVRHRLRTRNNVGHWMTPLHRKLGRVLNILTTKTIANCKAARQALLFDEKPNPDSVLVLENGVDLERFLHLTLKDNDPPIVGTVANLRYVKGLDLLVQAAVKVPDVTFQVVGEGEERPRLEQQIRELGLEQRFHLLGSRKDVVEFLGTLDVAVSSSRAEGMSNAILEYAAAARPIVATRAGATPEILLDQRDGLIVPPGNVEALVQGIHRLLQDRQLAKYLGESARRHVRERYSRTAMVRRFEDFYLQLVHRSERGTHVPQR